MTYAIMGPGAIGSALITHFSSKGMPVKVANRQERSSSMRRTRSMSPISAPSISVAGSQAAAVAVFSVAAALIFHTDLADQNQVIYLQEYCDGAGIKHL